MINNQTLIITVYLDHFILLQKNPPSRTALSISNAADLQRKNREGWCSTQRVLRAKFNTQSEQPEVHLYPLQCLRKNSSKMRGARKCDCQTAAANSKPCGLCGVQLCLAAVPRCNSVTHLSSYLLLTGVRQSPHEERQAKPKAGCCFDPSLPSDYASGKTQNLFSAKRSPGFAKTFFYSIINTISAINMI